MQSPLRIDLQLCGLMAVPERHPPLLDSVLLALRAQGQQLAEVTPDLLPVASHQSEDTTEPWYWLASAFDIEFIGPSVARFLYRNARPLDMLGHAQQHSASRVYLDRGVTRTVKSRVLLRQAVGATAWCLGDAPQLNELLSQLTHLGSLRHLGHGMVTGFQITEDPEAFEKCWLRPIPAPAADDPYSLDRIAIQGQCTPPYWDRRAGMSLWPSEAI